MFYFMKDAFQVVGTTAAINIKETAIKDTSIHDFGYWFVAIIFAAIDSGTQHARQVCVLGPKS
jgi:hypothetical protein